jgi:phospholipase A1
MGKGGLMKRLSSIYPCYRGAGKPLLYTSFVLILLGMPSAEAQSGASGDIAECAIIDNDEERLKCYDELATRQPIGTPPVHKPAEKTPEEKKEKTSYFSRLWELDKETRREKYVITPHRSNYILPFTYNFSPNVAAVQEADPDKDVKKEEVKFQLSLKVKLWQDILGKAMDLWFGYTQQSFWQLYNFEDSSPFRETNYEPELLLNFRTHYSLLGLKGRFINVGFNHQSNGQSEPLSRSWNRIVANLGLERDRFSLLLKAWYRIPEKSEDDDNPEIEKYLGYGEIWAYYFWKKNRFGIMLRNNLDFHTNRGAVQVEWSFPLFERVSGYLQYFLGYGESLLDYNHSVNRIGIGFILADWN